MIATKKCPNCGLDNQIDRSICENCTTALTEYGKQVGMADDFERRLANQVEALDDRPPVVHVMAGFSALLALPLLWDVIKGFSHPAQMDPENVNAISTAFAWLGPMFHAVILVPLSVLLIVLGFFTWTQRPWAWTANLALMGLTLVVMFTRLHFHISMFLWLIALGALTYFWTQPRTKAWYALH